MPAMLLPVAALLLSDALLLVGHGLSFTVLPLRAVAEGFSDGAIAITGSAYFVGFIGGCLLTPRVVRRVGHIRSFAVLSSAFSALVLLFPMVPEVISWTLLRAATGVCMSGLYMIIESWLNERASSDNRGALLSIYTIINLVMIILGQQAVNLAPAQDPMLFAGAAVLLSLAVIPVSLSGATAPAPLADVQLDLRALWRISPVGLGGAAMLGLITGSFWALGPVFGRTLGLDTQAVTWVISGATLGAALFQYPLGRLSDHLDRRLVLLFSCLAGAGTAFALALFSDAARPALVIGLSTLWGGFVLTLYAVCNAHANDRAEPSQFVMVGTSLLLTYGATSALGAPLAAYAMHLVGPEGLWWFSGAALLLFALGLVQQRQQKPRPVLEETEQFVLAASLTPAGLELDPRAESADDELANTPSGYATNGAQP